MKHCESNKENIMATKKGPLKTYRLGRIEVAVWENETKTGTIRNFTLSRTYKDGDKLSSTHSLAASDLENAAKLLTKASTDAITGQ